MCDLVKSVYVTKWRMKRVGHILRKEDSCLREEDSDAHADADAKATRGSIDLINTPERVRQPLRYTLS